MSEELKPCPFCGSKRIGIVSNIQKGYVVYCTNCKASTNVAARKEDAIYLWNKRAEVTDEDRREKKDAFG